MSTPSSLSGQRLGAYDVGPLLGAGGMGEVYRARDAKLNRDVAIKVLLPAVANDTERLARFRREAQMLASLNHPGIAQIHGLEDSASGPFLVMELVNGATLADRIAVAAIPVDEAIAIARQIVDALEAAHERGIIHRDLKPANIKVCDDGSVKILDFGLAKALDPQSGVAAGSLAHSPTITSPAMTQAGLILGTAAYMSPEQAKGRVVDKRTDVWAFGCVLYEMLTGRRAFGGEDVTDTIAAIVRGEPEWTALPADTPPQIRLLLQRCLEKDRKARISDIGVARFLMNETLSAPGAAVTASPRSRRTAVVAAAIGLAIGAVVTAAIWRTWSPPPERTTPVRFVFTPPAAQPIVVQGTDRDLAITPDGSFIVYRSGASAQLQLSLSIRGVNELEPRLLPGTNNGRFPFISADGRWVGFQAGNEIRKVAITGGQAEVVCRILALRGASWGDDDFIVFASPAGLQRVSAAGGEPTSLTSIDPDKVEAHVLPHVLPGSKWVVFTVHPGTDYLAARLEALEIATGRRKVIVPAGHDAMYVNSGHLVYGLTNAASDAATRFQASLRAVRFDPVRAEVIGESLPLVEQVRVGASPTLNYSVSRRGDLVYVPGTAPIPPTERTLTWVNRKGQETAIAAEPRAYAMARISPDGARVALDVRDQVMDIWIWDLNRQTLSSLNRHPSQDMSPIWTPDSKRVIWTSTRGGGNPNLYWQAADGSGEPERLTVHFGNQFPTSTTPDGAFVTWFGASGTTANGTDLFRLAMKDPARKVEPLLAAAGMDFGAEVSPDGRWLAYHSNNSGEFQVYVRPYPNVQDGREQVSRAGGSRPAWSRDGRELFYLDGDNLLTAVAVPAAVGARFTSGPPIQILKKKYYAGATLLGLDLRAYDVAPDGQRFLMIKDPEPAPGTSQTAVSLVVVLNWVEELKARLPVR